MNKKIAIVSVIFFLFFSSHIAFAESPYVLPYPSFMPGTVFYKIDKVIQFFEKYWYFGDFGKFTYNIKQSDKYLVEAETLFQYKQYLLGMQALEKSNVYFQQTQPNLDKAKQDGKDISDKETLLQRAIQKHIEVLSFMKTITPAHFVWSPEKTAASTLPIHNEIETSIQIAQHL